MMATNLRRARGTLSQAAFERAAARFPRMEPQNLQVAKAFLVEPGKLQVEIAEEANMSRQLVYKHCKKIYAAHCAIVKATRDK